MDDLLRTIADFRNKFEADFSTNHDVRSTMLNGPLQRHLEVPDPATAIEVEMTNSPLTTVPLYNSEADHCQQITAAEAHLKDKKKAKDMMMRIIDQQQILIDGGIVEPSSLKTSMDALKKAVADSEKRRVSLVHVHSLTALGTVMLK
ncbi:hypothetical protein CDAR_535311 [Caerostris darwini]|uniref:Uncharacterized protein n=1 Tax=Caerostris darwini TaxID=1538125 RepID=A0AAV4QIC9_9ARAC|nr:hypothetical protein CDAR_535311 [Caerostris darwini]